MRKYDTLIGDVILGAVVLWTVVTVFLRWVFGVISWHWFAVLGPLVVTAILIVALLLFVVYLSRDMRHRG